MTVPRKTTLIIAIAALSWGMTGVSWASSSNPSCELPCIEAFERYGYWDFRFADSEGVSEIAETVVPVELEEPDVGLMPGVDDVSIPGPPDSGTGASSASDSEFGYQDGDFGIFSVTVTAPWVEHTLIGVEGQSSFIELPHLDPR